MEERGRRILIVSLVVFAIIIVYAVFQAWFFFRDVKLVNSIREEVSSGMLEQAFSDCDNLHFWRNSLCSSLRVAAEVSSNPSAQLGVCDEIVIEYDGPWWLPVHQKYIDELTERKRSCVAAIISGRTVI